jgi:hypothetical protein
MTTDKKEVSDLGMISEAIRDAAAGMRSQPRVKLYVIFNDVYMHEEYNAVEFQGTWRQLLEAVNNINNGNRRDPFWVGPGEDDVKSCLDLTDEELIKSFDRTNGDGQPYYVVYCVDDHKKVLG